MVMVNETVEKAYERAKEVIKICSTRNGLFASGGKEGYDAVWARDSMISLIGASCSGDKEFKKVIIRPQLITNFIFSNFSHWFFGFHIGHGQSRVHLEKYLGSYGRILAQVYKIGTKLFWD